MSPQSRAPDRPAPETPDAGPGVSPAPAEAPGKPPASGPADPLASVPSLLPLPDPASWTRWWEHNRAPYLALKAALFDPSPSSPSRSIPPEGREGFFLGEGERTEPVPAPRRPSPLDVRDRLVPALVAALEAERSTPVQVASLVALARMGADQDSTTRAGIERLLQGRLDDPDDSVAEAAAAALGILAHESSAILLADVLLDARPGRKAVGGRQVPERLRAFAAYGLGLLGARSANEDVRRYVVHKLVRALVSDAAPSADLPSACVIALGRVPLPYRDEIPTTPGADAASASSSREAQVLFLLTQLSNPRLDRLARAHVPVALGRLLTEPTRAQTRSALRERVAEELLQRLERRRGVSAEEQQSCVLGLGLLGDNDADPIDARIRRRLLVPARLPSDELVRHLALVCAGQIGARDGDGSAPDPPVGALEVREGLLRHVRKARSGSARWAALGLAVLERGLQEGGHPGDPEAGRVLRERLGRASSPTDIGAYAIACGLLGDVRAEEPLLAALERTGDDAALGHVAQALGMLGARGSLPAIRSLVEGATYRPRLLQDAAIGLALVADGQAAAVLVEKLAKARSQSSRASVSRALGLIGDEDSLQPLLALVADRKLTDRARAFASSAIGSVADPDDLPWTTILSLETNYHAAPPTLTGPAGGGILDLP